QSATESRHAHRPSSRMKRQPCPRDTGLAVPRLNGGSRTTQDKTKTVAVGQPDPFLRGSRKAGTRRRARPVPHGGKETASKRSQSPQIRHGEVTLLAIEMLPHGTKQHEVEGFTALQNSRKLGKDMSIHSIRGDWCRLAPASRKAATGSTARTQQAFAASHPASRPVPAPTSMTLPPGSGSRWATSEQRFEDETAS